MKSKTSKRFWKCYDQLPSDIKKLTEEAFKLWQSNPRHPGLHFKNVHPSKPYFSVRIGIHWRAIGVLKADIIIWFWIGTHADYDMLVGQI